MDNPTGDYEVFTIKPDGTGLRQLTFNTTDDIAPAFSPDGQKIAYDSQGDYEIYVMNASDGKGKKNLSNNGSGVDDEFPDWSVQAT